MATPATQSVIVPSKFVLCTTYNLTIWLLLLQMTRSQGYLQHLLILSQDRQLVNLPTNSHFIGVTVATEKKDVNPFVMPPESAIFTLREKERLQAKEV